jgi:hypothetical protein
VVVRRPKLLAHGAGGAGEEGSSWLLFHGGAGACVRKRKRREIKSHQGRGKGIEDLDEHSLWMAREESDLEEKLHGVGGTEQEDVELLLPCLVVSRRRSGRRHGLLDSWWVAVAGRPGFGARPRERRAGVAGGGVEPGLGKRMEVGGGWALEGNRGRGQRRKKDREIEAVVWVFLGLLPSLPLVG